jgi:hypothetical protein
MDRDPPGQSSQLLSTWEGLLKLALGSLGLAGGAAAYVLVTGAPWNGVAATAVVFLGITALLLLFASGGYYAIDEL